MTWTVTIPGKVSKKTKRLPEDVQDVAELLVLSLASGPIRPEWSHYGKITGRKGCHHCHIQRGRPTYVAVWREIGPTEIEVTYVGTHEGAVYGRLC